MQKKQGGRRLSEAEVLRIAEALVDELSAPPAGNFSDRVSAQRFELSDEEEDRVAAAAMEILDRRH